MKIEDDSAEHGLVGTARNRSDLVREAQQRAEELHAAQSDWHQLFRRRLSVVAIIVVLWVVAIQARLVFLQVIEHDFLMQRAERQWSRTLEVPPKRGDLVDRSGRVLAFSVDGHAVFAEPLLVADAGDTARKVCDAISGCTPRDRAAMLDRLRRPRAFQYFWRRASPDDAARVRELKLTGIGVLSEQRRYYPNRELAAHVLGFTNLENTGLGGIESAFDRRIRGRSGRVLLQTDAKAQVFGRMERPPTAGATLELTIDRELQYIAERELAAGVAEFGASGGTVVVLEPKTGDVLALANWPTFNPNRFQDANPSRQRNRAIQEIYEPGSTFKIVTASAALEQNLFGLDETIDVGLGYIRFGSRQIDDVHRYGSLSFTDVIVKSSNVGAIKVGLRVGAERLVEYAHRFGFGQALARDLPGQTRGILWPAAQLTDSALASVSMGYQVGVTPMQMASAVNAIANGGELVEPRIVRALIEGNRRGEQPVKTVRRAISRDTAVRLTGIMEAVVDRGTAKAARMEGFTVAGKTGTAARLEHGRYSRSDYNASFVGFVPSREPAATILVVIDSPHGKGYYGGTVAAPIFKRIAEATMRHLGIAPNVDPSARVVVARRNLDDEAAVAPTPARVEFTTTSAAPAAAGTMPDLRGSSAREAARLLAEAGVAVQLLGDGLVVHQQIAAGLPIERGMSCVLRLSRSAAALLQARAEP